METYDTPQKIVSGFLTEIEKLKVPREFVRKIIYRNDDYDGKHGECYLVLSDKDGNTISTRRGMTPQERKKYSRLVGVETEIDEKSIIHEAKHVQQLFKDGLKGFYANHYYNQIEATFYELKRKTEEKLKFRFRRSVD
jgi:hypothetical protein